MQMQLSLRRKSEKEFESSSKAIQKIVAPHCFSKVRNAFFILFQIVHSSHSWKCNITNCGQKNCKQFIRQLLLRKKKESGLVVHNSHLIVVCITAELCQPCTMGALSYQVCKSTLAKLHCWSTALKISISSAICYCVTVFLIVLVTYHVTMLFSIRIWNKMQKCEIWTCAAVSFIQRVWGFLHCAFSNVSCTCIVSFKEFEQQIKLQNITLHCRLMGGDSVALVCSQFHNAYSVNSASKCKNCIEVK